MIGYRDQFDMANIVMCLTTSLVHFSWYTATAWLSSSGKASLDIVLCASGEDGNSESQSGAKENLTAALYHVIAVSCPKQSQM